MATVIGTIQSCFTHFPYLRDVWKKNTEEERLLGVSFTGVFDNPILLENPDLLERLKAHAVLTNKQYAEVLGIPRSAAITCVKPSGTVSLLVGASAGCHPAHAKYYVRTVRGDNKDPMTKFLKAQKVPNEPDAMSHDNVTVFSFPMKSGPEARTRHDVTAIEHLKAWLTLQRHWCEHKPSVTINVKDDEWDEVGDFVYEHFDEMSGVSFLPFSEHTYVQAPLQEITEEEYLRRAAEFPNVDFSRLMGFEKHDTTEGTQTLACTGGVCEITDIGNVNQHDAR